MKKHLSQINVKGGDLPSDFSIKLDITIDYSGISTEELINRVTSGQSDRVRIQTMLRKMTTNELTKLALTGYHIRWNQIGNKPERSVMDILMALSLEDFVAKLVKDIGIEEDKALEIYARKHGKDLEDVQSEWLDLNEEENIE